MMARTTIAVLIATLVSIQASAQPRSNDGDALDRFLRQQRLIDDELQRNRLADVPLESRVDFQWGGWVDYFYLNFDDGDQESRVFHRPSMALWGRVSVDGGAHEAFVRMRLRYDYWRPGDEGSALQEDWVGPELDQGWYQIDWGKALRFTQPDGPFQLKTRVGRQTIRFGTGYTLDLPMDAVLLDGKLYDVHVLGFLGKSIGNLPNVVRSAPVESHSDRHFAGVQLTYEGFQRHQPFIYGFFNNDKTKERPKDPFNDYSYDSAYLGIGSQGEILREFIPNLRYWAEGVYVTGKSFGDGAWRTRDHVEAWGWDVGVEKLFRKAWLKPRLSFEYMFGSGDPDHLFTPYAGAGGNRTGTEDRSFIAFGSRDTGLALAPGLSNLHIWKLGGAIQPFDGTKIHLLRGFEVGNNFFLYAKNQASGPISDGFADQSQNYVGWGLDTFVNWRLTSDLAWTVRFGTFFPGSAYGDKDTRFLFLTGLTWSF